MSQSKIYNWHDDSRYPTNNKLHSTTEFSEIGKMFSDKEQSFALFSEGKWWLKYICLHF